MSSRRPLLLSYVLLPEIVKYELKMQRGGWGPFDYGAEYTTLVIHMQYLQLLLPISGFNWHMSPFLLEKEV